MRPNVLIITVDALRADRVGVLGGKDLTPHVDDFASDAAVFSNAYTTAPATDPAVTTVQTGRYPLSHGIVNHGWEVTEKEKRAVESVPQLQELFADAGYHTFKLGRPLGRWHRKGFDRYPMAAESREAFDRNVKARKTKRTVKSVLSSVDPRVGQKARELYKDVTGSWEATPGEEESADELVASFEEVVGDQSPFYGFVHLMDTHAPYTAPPETVSSYLDRFDYDVRPGVGVTEKIPQAFHRAVTSGEYPEIAEKYYYPDDEPSTAVADACYDASVTRADGRIGRLLELLREHDRYDETLVVVLADHGESLTEHGIYYAHHGLYDVSVHVPLLIKPPEGTDVTVEDYVQLTDVAPTVASYTDIDGLSPDGRSLEPAIEDGESVDREFVVADEAHTQRRRMVRTRDEKLIYLVDGDTICRYCEIQHAPEKELYDLEADPLEEVNGAGDHPDRVVELRERGDTAAEEFRGRRRDDDGDADITYEDEDEIHDRLEALGYR